MHDWKLVGMPSNRAEMLSMAVRANMRKRRDLPIAMALQPVAAVAWVPSLAGGGEGEGGAASGASTCRDG